jgi:threonine dehydratase
LAASLSAAEPVEVTYEPSFVDGIGAPVVFSEMFELARTLLDGSLVVEPVRAADAVRLLATRAHVVAEGAGGVPVAAATAGLAGRGQVVAVVSGGSIDASELANILAGGG